MSNREFTLWRLYKTESDPKKRRQLLLLWAAESDREMIKILLKDVEWLTKQKGITEKLLAESTEILLDAVEVLKEDR